MMSRSDSREFDYPSGLNGLRTHSNEIQPGHYPNVVLSPRDRLQSGAILSHNMYASNVSRSLGLQEKEFGYGIDFGPNRHNPNSNAPIPSQSFTSFNHNHPRRPSPPSLPPSPENTVYSSTTFNNDRDAHIYRHAPHNPTANTPPLPPNSHASRCTLWWGEIEPWMDEEYAKQVCTLMGWDPVSVKVPHPAPDPVTGQQANNPGYCFLTFGTPAHAASVLAQFNNSGTGNPITMPNSAKPFVLNWASAVPSVSPVITYSPAAGPATGPLQQYPKEYSIFVGDLAPETSNSDLVAVFRNPVLGLRNDREPKFIRPFLSCKSAKIMLDPVTGVSRGYGFVRFTDEADQQRALIEMHGLYCLSRPMRISPATAKFKPPPVPPSMDLPQVQFPPQNGSGLEQQPQPVTIALPLPHANQTKSVSVPIATTTSNTSLSTANDSVSNSHSGTSIGASNSSNSFSSGTGSSSSLSSAPGGSVSSEEMMNLPNSVLAQIAQQYANGEVTPIKVHNGTNSITPPYVQDAPIRQSFQGGAPRYTISEESWKHHAQARAILGNLIGPNGEQLTSTDPYNTTVFVGGLSPLISEETLRTFFAPFGDIHYVKVPVGKHCGFVQFVRKADAERAIEKMQGFPVGGSRIRLSWGRSQYKAAQAAAQAAQAASLQPQFSVSAALPSSNMMTQEQAIQLLQKLNLQGYLGDTAAGGSNTNVHEGENSTAPAGYSNAALGEHKIHPALLTARRDERPSSYDSFSSNAFPAHPEIHRSQSQFAPFSPDPNAYMSEVKRHDPRTDVLTHPSKAFGRGFYPLQTQDLQMKSGVSSSSISKTSPTSARPASASASASGSRYNAFLESSNHSFPVNRAPGRPEAPVSRPPSGQMTGNVTRMEQDNQELEAMHDLNGTLASLELDRPWKSPAESTGGAAVRVSNEKAPSP